MIRFPSDTGANSCTHTTRKEKKNKLADIDKTVSKQKPRRRSPGMPWRLCLIAKRSLSFISKKMNKMRSRIESLMKIAR